MDSDISQQLQRRCSTNAALLDPARFGWTASGGVSELLHPRRRTHAKLTKKSTNTSRASKKRGRREAFSNSNGMHLDSVDASIPSRYDAIDKGLSSLGVQNKPTQSTWTQNGISEMQNVATSGSPAEYHSTGTANDDIKGETISDGALQSSSLEGVSNETVQLHASESSMDTGMANEASPVRDSENQMRTLGDLEDAVDIFHYDQSSHVFEFNDAHTSDLTHQGRSSQMSQIVENGQPMVVTVTIQIPLGDEINAHHEGTGIETRFYHDEIQWNLATEDALNPMVFATQMAQEFGLSYSQTWDLAESIQDQLQSFVNDNFAQTVPTVQNKDVPPATCVPMVPILYCDVTGYLQEGGTCRPYKPKPKEPPLTRNVASAESSTTAIPCEKLPTKRRDSVPSQKAEYPFYVQVQERLQRLLVTEARTKHNDSITLRNNHTCHLCRASRPLSGVFACGLSSHAYCWHHLSEQLGLTNKSQLQHVEHCPICTLSCTCVSCVSRLDIAASDFKTQCLAQRTSPEDAVFEDLLAHCRKIEKHCEVKNASTGGPSRKYRTEPRQACVQKLPPSVFPKEVTNGVDSDLSFEKEYRTVFTRRGWFLLSPPTADTKIDPIRPPSPGHEEVPLEDGSVDFCNVCRKVGDLLCCDFCPRAFHKACLPPATSQTNSVNESQWECPSCCQEKNGLAEDNIDGSGSIAQVRDVCGAHCVEEHLTLLSILHEMICTLIDFDFGYIFQSPVDREECPTYTTVVKNPMDLGTIRTNLLRRSNKIDPSPEERALSTLKNIELVWHNCFMFNVEGSAVYRMAELQKRRAGSIRKQSVDHLLSERVKQELVTYTNILARERDDYRLESPLLKRKVKSSLPPQMQNNKSGPSRPIGRSRPVAVFDHESGRIVKIYSALHSAGSAVRDILRLNKHECEWAADSINTDGKLRRVITRSQEDPLSRLYGYRWLYLDSLHNGSIVLPGEDADAEIDDDPHIGTIEMVDNGLSFFFHSIAEAVSFPNLPCEIPDLLARLKLLTPDDGSKQIAGRFWRLLSTPRHHSADRDHGAAIADVSSLAGVEYVREDVVLGKSQLVGFPHVKAAYEDWCQSVDASVTPFTGPKSIDTFMGVYLDSSKTVDGMTWRRVPPLHRGDYVAPHSNNVPGRVPQFDPTSRARLDREPNEPSERPVDRLDPEQSEPLESSVDRLDHEQSKPLESSIDRLDGEQSEPLESPVDSEDNGQAVSLDRIDSNGDSIVARNHVDHGRVGGAQLVSNRRDLSVANRGAASLASSQHEATSTTSQSTENSRSSKVFDLETVFSSPRQSIQNSMTATVAVLNGLSENCHVALHVPSRDDGIEVVSRRDASTLG